MGDLYTVVAVMTGTPASPATLLLVTASASKRLRLRRLDIGSRDASASASAEFTIGRPGTSGTGGSAYTPVPVDPAAPAALFSALQAGVLWSAEPTQGLTVVRQGLNMLTSYVWEGEILVPVSARLAVRIETDGAATNQLWAATALIEE